MDTQRCPLKFGSCKFDRFPSRDPRALLPRPLSAIRAPPRINFLKIILRYSWLHDKRRGLQMEFATANRHSRRHEIITIRFDSKYIR